jgi:F0F1-type ATP synthase membrane subunit a
MLVLLCIFLNILLFSCLNKKDYTLHVRSTRCQSILEIFYSLILSKVRDNINSKKSSPFFLVFCLFNSFNEYLGNIFI